jgi:hypothetical protein
MLAPALAALAISSCRFGGPSGNPEAYVAFADGGDDGEAGSPSEAGTVVDDATTGDEEAPAEASADDASSDDAGDARVDDASCTVAVPICDPVHNTGCDALHQCDVDTSQSKPTGICVFYSASDAGTCSSSIFNETCAPRSTCASGSCRALCFCDSDCPAAQCCAAGSGPGGFGVCGVCP